MGTLPASAPNFVQWMKAEVGRAREVLPMTRTTSLRPARVSAAVLLCGVLGGCDYAPAPASDVHFTLAEANRLRLVKASEDGLWEAGAAEGAEAQILGALEMLVGTPQAPKFVLTEEMIKDEWDPNLPHYGLLDEEILDQVATDNRARRFEDQLALIEQGRFEEVPEPLYAADLWAQWEGEYLPALLENPDEPYDADDPEYGTWKERAVALFVEHYPTLQESAELYRVQCLHCHGVSGGGDGPTGEYLSPRPRDYRQGLFKWISVDRNQRPRRSDLQHILEYGVPRTAMPSFARFSRGQIEGLIDYVRLLAIRGEVETFLVTDTIDTEYGDVPLQGVADNYNAIWARWESGPATYKHYEGGQVPRPGEMTTERIAHGKELFLGETAACSTCHGVLGRGDGESAFEDKADGDETVHRKKLDEWGVYLETGDGPDNVLEADAAKPFASNPRNLQLNNFRGGGRPVDIYRRIKFGISGTIMPAASTELTDEDLWDLVYYALSIGMEFDPARIQEHRAEVEEHGHEHDDDSGGHGDGHDDDAGDGDDAHDDDSADEHGSEDH